MVLCPFTNVDPITKVHLSKFFFELIVKLVFAKVNKVLKFEQCNTHLSRFLKDSNEVYKPNI